MATLDEGPGTNEFKTKKWQIEAKPTWHMFWRENQLVQTQKKTVLKGELLIWRTNYQAMDQGTLQLKDSICFKSVPTKLDPRLNWA